MTAGTFCAYSFQTASVYRRTRGEKGGQAHTMKISSVAEMQAFDQAAINDYGIAEGLLMENAGHAVYEAIRSESGIDGKTFAVLCGTGNNGGDGLVVARKLLSMGGRPTVLLAGDGSRFRGAAAQNFEILSRLPIPVVQCRSATVLREQLAQCDLVVDALLGTGLTRHVDGLYSELVSAVNACGKPVCSIDIPSGISGNTGLVMGAAVRADFTVTFGLPKRGNLLYPGFEHCGKLFVSHISFPPALYESCRVEVNQPLELPRRAVDGHKGSFGDVLFVAGAAAYYGAPGLCALAFLKAGGGYSRLASPASIIPIVAARGSEIVFVPQQETVEGSLSAANRDDLLDLAKNVDMVVVGPGLSLNQESLQLAIALVQQIDKPLLVDGDGLTALAQADPQTTRREAPTVLTPHIGEMCRLTGLRRADVVERRIDVLQKETEKRNAIIVLKGAHSLIGYPDGRVFLNLTGNSGMATAGSGDVLTGTIGAMFGLGLSLPEAVRAGVFVHGMAGDLAAEAMGEDGMTARDILAKLPEAVRRYRESYAKVMAHYHGNITSL